MKFQLSSLLSAAVFTLGNGIFSLTPALAQVTTDGTTSTTVTNNDAGVQIDNGNRNGDNLFHSFDEFSVPTNTEAYFNNGNDVVNIFSRVTGGNISNINGILRANGAANLFLINPAGILFGENAKLQLGGSFYGSTADSIIFPDGEFSATDLDNPPLITVNAPIGLGFRNNLGEIVNQSTAEDLGLQIASANTFALVGGNIRFTGGLVNAPGANVELGGLTETGIVTINQDGSLSFSDSLARANIILDDASVVDVISNGGGSITVNAQNFELLSGSTLSAGILEGTESPEAQAGDIVINVSEKIILDSQDTNLETSIQNVAGNVSEDLAIDLFTKGSPGNISINTKIIEGSGNFSIISANNGEGNVGNVNITATESISLKGQAEFFPGFGSAVGLSGIGDGGDVIVTTPSLTILDANILTSTFGQGNAGNININVTESLTINGESQLQALSIGGGNSGNIIINGENANVSLTGEDLIITTTVISLETQFASFPEFVEVLETLGFSSALGSQGGDIVINARNLSADNNVQIATSTLAKASTERLANAGNIEINVAENLNFSNSSFLFSDTAGQGNAGNISINAGETVSLDKTSLISTGIQQKSGDLAANFTQSVRGGDINIASNSLSLTDGSLINSSTLDRGNAGNISITARESILIDSTTSNPAGIFSIVGADVVGNGGEINIVTNNLLITGFGEITANTSGQGNTGSIFIIAENILLDAAQFDDSGIFNVVGTQAVGNGGEIKIATTNLALSNGATIDASTDGQGNGGAISIVAKGDISLDGTVVDDNQASAIGSAVAPEAVGDGGNISIDTKNLSITGQGGILSSSLGQGNAGTILINATGNIFLDGAEFENSGIFSDVRFQAIGNGGEIKITTTNFTLDNGANINSVTRGQGNGGEIKIATTNLAVSNGSSIDASTDGQGNGGNIFITAEDSVSLDGTTPNREFVSVIGSLVGFNAAGNGGEIKIKTNTLSITDGAFLSTSTLGKGDVGKISIIANESIIIDGQTSDGNSPTGISNDILVNAVGNSNNITILTDKISLSNQGAISNSSQGQGNGGNIDLVANTLNLDRGGIFAANQPSQPTNINESRVGGNINLEISDNITLRNNSFISAQAGENASGGNITINTDFIVAFPSRFDGSDIRADAEQGKGGNITINAESVIGIAERTLNPLTNDINASSEVAGLAGTISINTPDINPLRAKVELPSNPISTNIVATDTCQVSTTAETSSLIVKGKGGLIPEITNPLMADNLIINEQEITINPFLIKPISQENLIFRALQNEPNTATSIPAQIKPAITTKETGELYAARGITQQEDGTVYLTAYPTSSNQRVSAGKFLDCGYD